MLKEYLSELMNEYTMYDHFWLKTIIVPLYKYVFHMRNIMINTYMHTLFNTNKTSEKYVLFLILKEM